MIHPPTHLYYYDKKTISLFLGRFGLRVVEATSMPMYRNLGTTIGMLQVLGGSVSKSCARVADFLLPSPIKNGLGMWIDVGDIMFVAAQKE